MKKKRKKFVMHSIVINKYGYCNFYFDVNSFSGEDIDKFMKNIKLK